MKAKPQAGPGLFDELVGLPRPERLAAVQAIMERELIDGTSSDPRTPVGFITSAPAHVYLRSPQEDAASRVDIPERSRWTLKDKREVEVRGTSPLLVWFTEPGASVLTQQTCYRHEFLKKAVRL